MINMILVISVFMFLNASSKQSSIILLLFSIFVIFISKINIISMIFFLFIDLIFLINLFTDRTTAKKREEIYVVKIHNLNGIMIPLYFVVVFISLNENPIEYVKSSYNLAMIGDSYVFYVVLLLFVSLIIQEFISWVLGDKL